MRREAADILQKIGKNLTSEEFRITTTLDPHAQKAAELATQYFTALQQLPADQLAAKLTAKNDGIAKRIQADLDKEINLRTGAEAEASRMAPQSETLAKEIEQLKARLGEAEKVQVEQAQRVSDIERMVGEEL